MGKKRRKQQPSYSVAWESEIVESPEAIIAGIVSLNDSFKFIPIKNDRTDEVVGILQNPFSEDFGTSWVISPGEEGNCELIYQAYSKAWDQACQIIRIPDLSYSRKMSPEDREEKVKHLVKVFLPQFSFFCLYNHVWESFKQDPEFEVFHPAIALQCESTLDLILMIKEYFEKLEYNGEVVGLNLAFAFNYVLKDFPSPSEITEDMVWEWDNYPLWERIAMTQLFSTIIDEEEG